jgi:phosphatidylethanolamine-binding protein (PEBP) family uncharacterized protein
MTSNQPVVSFTKTDKNSYYTLLLIDPDAVLGNKIHWLIINISAHDNYDCLFPYLGPHPPRESGIHQYRFLLYKQRNGKMMINKNSFSSRYISLDVLLKKFDNKLTLLDQKYFLSSFTKFQNY